MRRRRHTQISVDADFVARVGDGDLLHVEWQGYRDTTFLDRLFSYHLNLVLRYPERRVRTVAVWLIPPPASQRSAAIVRGDVTVQVTHLVLAEVPAAELIASGHAFLAPGGELRGRDVDELCDEIVARR